jgi:polyferredoxin
MAEQGTKPYLKLASTLVLLGIGLFSLEQFGLSRAGPGGSAHLDGTILSILVIAPLALVAAGVLTFIIGKMRRL